MPDSKSGFAVLSRGLDDCAAAINEELSHLNRLFSDELIPRCKSIGQTLAKARGLTTTTADFYKWAEESVGIKQRQVRTYLRFAEKLPSIEAVAEEQEVKLTSMEQGLALLAPPKEEKDSDTDGARHQAMAAALGRAKGALTRARDAIAEVVGIEGIDKRHLQAFEAMECVLDVWGSSTPTEDGGVIMRNTSEAPKLLAVDRQDDWSEESPTETVEVEATPAEAETNTPSGGQTDTQKLASAGLPMSEKPSKWTLAQLEQGLALVDDSQTRLAAAMGVTKAAVSSQLKKKRPNPVDESPTSDPSDTQVAA